MFITPKTKCLIAISVADHWPTINRFTSVAVTAMLSSVAMAIATVVMEKGITWATVIHVGNRT